MPARPKDPGFVALFTPKLVTAFREGYRLGDLRADLVAGLTVAIVALPLSMAIAIASGVSPGRGLTTAIVGGLVVSALGGSRFQIGGPAGAFIVLVAATVEQHGVEGLILATFLSGVILLGIGFARLGSYIKYIPYPVTVGFTAGIAVIIFASQLKELLGLTLPGREPGALVPKLAALAHALPSLNHEALLVSLLGVAIIVALRRARPAWPGFLIAVTLTSALAWSAGLHVETIGSRFGGIPGMLPAPHLPAIGFSDVVAVLPAAISFALLGSIESLLSAVVADGMSGRRHRSNCELVAQGAANIAASLFGGFCVTGTIARTATNVRAGAHSPLSGVFHSLFLLAFMMVAAPLASFIPLASLGALLAVVTWNMADRHDFARLLRASRGDAVVLLTTFLLVIFRDLTEGIVVGFSIGALLFLHRMAQSVRIETGMHLVDEDEADGDPDIAMAADTRVPVDPDVVVYRISGAFFFGAAGGVATALDQMGRKPKAYVLDISRVPMVDSTAAATILAFARKAAKQGASTYLAGATRPIVRILRSHGVRPPDVRFRSSLGEAVAAARQANATATIVLPVAA